MARDVVHINWDPIADVEWQTYDWGNPARTEARTASVRLDLLGTMEECDEPHPLFRWTRSELADLMRVQAPSLSWAVVIKTPIIVHATTAAHDGLFDLLGDAPVQFVDTSNETRINQFLQLGDRPGITLSPRLEPGELVRAQREFQDVETRFLGPRTRRYTQ